MNANNNVKNLDLKEILNVSRVMIRNVQLLKKIDVTPEFAEHIKISFAKVSDSIQGYIQGEESKDK